MSTIISTGIGPVTDVEADRIAAAFFGEPGPDEASIDDLVGQAEHRTDVSEVLSLIARRPGSLELTRQDLAGMTIV